MAFGNFREYSNRLATAPQLHILNGVSTGAGTFGDSWLAAPNAQPVPGTAATLDNTSPGALNYQTQIGEGSQKWLIAQLATNSQALVNFQYQPSFMDRLVHTAGLQATGTTTAQTTNLPTPALPRYTTGAGVHAAVVIWSAVGATATTFTVSYTNQAGTSGRTSQPSVIGGASNNAVGRLLHIPPAGGDTGFRSIESVTLAGNTGTVGNFGILLYKPLLYAPFVGYGNAMYAQNQWNALTNGGAPAEPILPGCCLSIFSSMQNSSTLEYMIATLVETDT